MEDSILQSAILSVRQPQIPDPTSAANTKAANEIGKEFEAFFMSQVMESMFAGIETNGPFGGGFGEGEFRSLLFQEYGKQIAGRGGIGIADAVQKEVLRIQEATIR